jgi:hypothetical protein
MAIGVDPTREFQNQFKPQEPEGGEEEQEKSSDEKSKEKAIRSAEKRRGEDPIPKNLDSGRFPAPLVSPTIDGLGDWTGQYRNLEYPGVESKSGFTNQPILPQELSRLKFNEKNLKLDSQPVAERIKVRKQYYNLVEDYSTKQFTHLLDYFSAQKGLGDLRPIPTGTYENGKTLELNTRDIYLGSFIKTLDEQEQPTMLGYDIKLKWNDSPLLNGTAQAFIGQFGKLGNSEIAARSELLSKFIEQLTRFFKVNEPSKNPLFEDKPGAKTYYMRKITGLNKLVESLDSSEGKQFVDYGKDFIELTFNEDVTQNLAYLASLYKSLSYSRRNGKQILPENVLRFDAEIEVTEIRKFKRVFKNLSENRFESVADKISKYTYTLYECQFFFPTLTHTDTLDMSASAELEEFTMKFNFKWSTMKFSKFSFDSPVQPGATFSLPIINEYAIDNKNRIPTEFRSNVTNNNGIVQDIIQSAPPTYNPQQVGFVDLKSNEIGNFSKGESKGGELQPVKDEASKKGTEKPESNSTQTDTTDKEIEPKKGKDGQFKDRLAKQAKDFAEKTKDFVVNKGLQLQASLINKTLAGIFNAFSPLNLNTAGGRAQGGSKQNIYPPLIPDRLPVSANIPGLNYAIQNKQQKLVNFVGTSVKNFFEKR